MEDNSMSEKNSNDDLMQDNNNVEEKQQRRSFVKTALGIAGAAVTLGMSGNANAANVKKRSRTFLKLSSQQRASLVSKLKVGLKNREILAKGGSVGRGYSDYIDYNDHIDTTGALQQRRLR